jgi:hypothetical protein
VYARGLVSDMMGLTESGRLWKDALAEDESEEIEGGSKPKRLKMVRKNYARAAIC